MDHAVPSQCSVNVLGDPGSPVTPTDQQSDAFVQVTPRSSVAVASPGVGTMDQAVPFQFSARPSTPTAQRSVLFTHVKPGETLLRDSIAAE